MFQNLKLIILFLITSMVLISCQKTEFYDQVVFDNSLLHNITFNAETKNIIVSYEPILSEPFIEHVMSNSPTNRVMSWIEDNITNLGSTNKLVIDINKVSIIRNEITTEKKIAGVLREQNEYLYEMDILIDYILYDDYDKVIATTHVEVHRSTTSSKFISLNERNHILDFLTLESLKDLSNKSIELLKMHMSGYIL